VFNSAFGFRVGACLLLAAVTCVWPDLYFLDHPTGLSLKHGEFMVSGRLQAGGGIMSRACVGLFDRLTLGLSYSVDSFFGPATPRLPPFEAAGFQARLLGLDEGSWNPSIMVGFESQGYDGYQLSYRFLTLPPGGYLLLGKTFWATRTEVSAGANYLPPLGQGTAEGFDGHLAIREFYFPDWDFILEYDPVLNDPLSSKELRGLLNLAIARNFGGSVNLKLALRDVLSCHAGNGLNRVFDISFQQHF
jgi:hypothetical protein